MLKCKSRFRGLVKQVLISFILCGGIFHEHALSQDTLFGYNPLWTTYYYLDEPAVSYHVDTTLQFVNRYHPAEAPFGYLHIGQAGAPATAMFPYLDEDAAFDVGFHQFDIYWLTPDAVKFYDSKHPYTVVGYQQGAKSEIKASFIHTQNIIPQLSVGVEMHRLRTDGFYQRQVSRISNFDAFTRYSSNSGVYHLDVAYILNSAKVDENGGVASQDVFIDTTIFDKSLVPVRLDSAGNRWKNDVVFFQNSFDIGKFETVKKNDSVDQKVVRPFIRLQHFFEYEKRSYDFRDAATDNEFYEHIYLDSTVTRDTFRYQKISNEVRISLPDSIGRYVKHINSSVYFHHDYYKIESQLTNEPVFNGIGGIDFKKYFDLDSAGDRQLFLKFSAAYNFFDFNKDDYFLKAATGFSVQNRWELSAEVLKNQQHPAYIDQNFLSNNFDWHNSFVPVQTNAARFFLIDNKWKLALKAEVFTIKNRIYWNTDALPAQYGPALNGYTIFLQKNFTLKSFHLDNELQYQHFNVDTVITYPAFYLRSSLYFEDKLFKGALESRVGVDIHYTADYYGPAYMPAIGQFYVQREDFMNFYPAADLFINIKVKSVRAFVMFQNIGMGLFAAGYFSAYRYPMPDRAFKLGLEWKFWN